MHTTLQACPDDDRLLQVRVADTGDGMTAEIAARIFDRMYQSADHVEHSRKGLGLGLFICRELVVRQGGTIQVVSVPGIGSTFSFTVPAYSLTASLAPLLTEQGWPGDIARLVVVDVEVPEPPAASGGARWSHDVRAVIVRCLLPNLDALLSSVRSGRCRERFFVAAFADERGVSILERRIRGELERLACVRQCGTRLTVSVVMLPPCADALEGPRVGMLARMSALFEAALSYHSTTGNDTHEQQENPRR